MAGETGADSTDPSSKGVCGMTGDAFVDIVKFNALSVLASHRSNGGGTKKRKECGIKQGLD